MKSVQSCAVAIGLLFAAAAGAEDKKPENKLPDAVAKALEKAEEVEVYSLNGATNEKDGWHAAKVLGKTTVKEADARKALATAVAKGVSEGKVGALCFIPRHGIRVKYDGKTYDLLICFECNWVRIYTDNSNKPLILLTSDSAQKALNKLLTDAKVPLDKPE